MSLESSTYISGLNAANPLAGDPRSDGDDHLRLIKSVLKNTFPNANGVINPTPAEFNYLVGVTSNIQTQLNALNTSKAPMPATTATLFYQGSAPTGWTKSTANNDKALRVVSGTGGVAGGSVAFSTAFASKSVTGTVGGTALTKAQIPRHKHRYTPFQIGGGLGNGGSAPGSGPGAATDTDDGVNDGLNGDTHTHTFTGTAINLAVQYCDVIIATRN